MDVVDLGLMTGCNRETSTISLLTVVGPAAVLYVVYCVPSIPRKQRDRSTSNYEPWSRKNTKKAEAPIGSILRYLLHYTAVDNNLQQRQPRIGVMPSSSKKSESRDERKRKKDDRKRKKKSKKQKRQKHDRKRYYSSSSEDEDNDSYDREHRHSRSRKRSKKERRPKSSHSKLNLDDDSSYLFVEALFQLLNEHPLFATDLPIMLIRLGQGTAFDLSKMTDRSAAQGLQHVFKALVPYGLDEISNMNWKWAVPPGVRRDDELAIIRIVRSLLDEQGITIPSIENIEKPSSSGTTVADEKRSPIEQNERTSFDEVHALTQRILSRFGKDGIGKELVGLCEMIQAGEVVSVDEIPNEDLKKYLTELFDEVGLEQTAMEADESKDNNKEEEDFGYVIPQNGTAVVEKIQEVINYCHKVELEAAKPKVKGPSLPTAADFRNEESDDEGPALPGATRTSESTSYAASQAKDREQMMKALRGEVERDPNAREEWMVDPGKYDLFAAVKAGQPMRSRSFKPNTETSASAVPMDPDIHAEVEAIRHAHEEYRGQSLLELHREKKQQEKKEGHDKWKWSRGDLDVGRRVDKEALKQVFGGASSDLKNKFQGGFG